MNRLTRPALGGALAAVLAAGFAVAVPAPAQAAAILRGKTPVRAERPSETMNVSAGRGTLVTLPAAMTDVFVAGETIADVQVRSPTQLWVFGKAAGETSVYATNKAGQVLWSTIVRVAPNIETVGDMLKIAMPDATITVTPMTGAVLLTGVVATPDDVAEATRLAQAFLGEKTQVITKLRTATPLQVNLQVKIVEVSRSVGKVIGLNLLTRDTTGGFTFGVTQGRTFGSISNADGAGFPVGDASTRFGLPPGSVKLPFDPKTGQFITGTNFNFDQLSGAGFQALGFAGKLFGLDIATALDLAETQGLVTTLAEPNLTTLSGETASFLAGGEIPVPQSQGLGAVSVDFKQYGVSLAFTPVVLSDGRISIRVRPEVSQLTDAGSVRLNGFVIPALTTRRAETTVELGSGQSFMIGGLLQNAHNNTTEKAPFLGDLPIIGSLFRSNSFRRSETELMIVVTPYLVKPVDAARIALPTDGYKAATDAERVMLYGKPVASDAGQMPKRPAAAPAPAGSTPTGSKK